MLHDDSNATLTAALIGSVFLASTAPEHLLEGMPISAGITCTVLAGFKSVSMLESTSKPYEKLPRYRWVIPMISGAATGIFCGQFVTDSLGWKSLNAMVFAYFLLGLLGSTYFPDNLRFSGGNLRRIPGNAAFCPFPTELTEEPHG